MLISKSGFTDTVEVMVSNPWECQALLFLFSFIFCCEPQGPFPEDDHALLVWSWTPLSEWALDSKWTGGDSIPAWVRAATVVPRTPGNSSNWLGQSEEILLHWVSDNLGTRARRRQWHPTPGLLPGKPHGWRGLVGCSPWGCWESDTTKWLHFHFSLSLIGEGNGNPFQCSCLENPRDGGAWWADVCGVTQSRTRLKRLGSSRDKGQWVTGTESCPEPG